MGSAAIFAGTRTKLLTSKGLLLQDGTTLDNDGWFEYIKNGKADIDTTGWATYADAAAASPVDGTAGSPTATWTRSTTTPLRGVAHFLLTKDAANRQGNGASYAFTIDTTDQAKVLQVSTDFQVMSGTYVSGDVTIWIYDLTNATLIQPVGYSIDNAVGPVKLRATFQTASNSTSYRLIIHIASTSAAAYTLAFDSIGVGPQVTANTFFGTDTQAWPTLTTSNTAGFGTPSDTKLHWRRDGDRLEGWGRFTAGTTTATTASITLPSGLSVSTDANKISASNEVIGKWWRSSAAGTSEKNGSLVAYNGSGTTINFGRDDYTQANAPAATALANAIISTGNDVYISFSVPIQGWGSNVISSVDAGDGRVVSFRATGQPTGTITGTDSIAIWGSGSVAHDTHGNYSSSTGRYTITVPGYYRISAHTSVSAVYVAGNVSSASIYKNAVLVCTGLDKPPAFTGTSQAAVADVLNLIAGDIIDVRVASGGTTPTYSAVAAESSFSINRVSGPSAIAAGETVAARYTTTAGQSITQNVTTQIVDFGTKDFDTHGSVTTGAGWKFTAQIPGKYSLQIHVGFASATFTATNNTITYLYKNGALFSILNRSVVGVTGTQSPGLPGTDVIPMLAGDYIDVRAYQEEAAARTLNAGAGYNHIAITRVGN